MSLALVRCEQAEHADKRVRDLAQLVWAQVGQRRAVAGDGRAQQIRVLAEGDQLLAGELAVGQGAVR